MVEPLDSVEQGFFAAEVDEGAVGVGDKEDGEDAVPVRFGARAREWLTTEGENLVFCGIRGHVPNPHRVPGIGAVLWGQSKDAITVKRITGATGPSGTSH